MLRGMNPRLMTQVRGRCLLAVTVALAALPVGAQEPPDTNYDESRVGSYELPDPLKCFDGRAVSTPALWREVRRPELLAAFATNIYGRTPELPFRLRAVVTDVAPAALGGLATRKQATIRLFDDADAPWIDLLLYLPNGVPSPVPVFLGLSYGNQGVNPDPGIRPSRDTTPKPGEQANRWPLELILRRGYAVATFAGADVEQDRHGSGSLQRPDGWRSGIRGYALRRAGRSELAADEWGSLGAWAWGLSRALDHLEQEPAVDARRVAVFGHSRTGKAALWAAAQDERFALCIANNSGQGGAALARRRFGETVAASYALSGAWYCRNYERFGGRESGLPVDAHELIALIAPRPVYVASAIDDGWADPRGEFLAALHAAPVYELLGRTGIGTDAFPAVDQPVGGSLGYHVRAGDHDLTAFDWVQFLDFADRHFGREARGAGAAQRLTAMPRPGSDTAALEVRSPGLPGEPIDFRTCEGVVTGERDLGLFQVKLAVEPQPGVPSWSSDGPRLRYVWDYPAGVRVRFEGAIGTDSVTVSYTVENSTAAPLERVQIHTCVTTTETPSFFPHPTIVRPAAGGGSAASTNYAGLFGRLFLWDEGRPFAFGSAPMSGREVHLAFMQRGESPVNWGWWVNAPERFDLPLIAARSRDGRHLIGLAFERAIWASSNVGDERACFHLFPHFGRIEAGGRSTVRGRLYVTRGDLEALRGRVVRDLAGGFPST